MAKVINCECGFVVRGADDDELGPAEGEGGGIPPSFPDEHVEAARARVRAGDLGERQLALDRQRLAADDERLDRLPKPLITVT